MISVAETILVDLQADYNLFHCSSICIFINVKTNTFLGNFIIVTINYTAILHCFGHWCQRLC